MKQLCYVQKKAEDLKLGDMFAYWAVMKDNLYPKPSRILDIKNGKKEKLEVILADGQSYKLKPEMIVVIQEYV